MAEGQGGLEHSILPAAGKWGAIGFGQLYPALAAYSAAHIPTLELLLLFGEVGVAPTDAGT
ncbi:hypothetical protein PoMZ_06722 [Pyricularia oryzae]|uniref:Uncharacterized protein n=1 Tax=Pyricularia oryzae TaxID=318829 RepID=A0A4P7NRU0_PYROR|nr:hypothetical protein PoMZ_06722 [Pyricularia oryzae]